MSKSKPIVLGKQNRVVDPNEVCGNCTYWDRNNPDSDTMCNCPIAPWRYGIRHSLQTCVLFKVKAANAVRQPDDAITQPTG